MLGAGDRREVRLWGDLLDRYTDGERKIGSPVSVAVRTVGGWNWISPTSDE